LPVIYEQNQDFENRYWLTEDQPEFEFFIDNAALRYNLYCDVRNEVSYPKSNIYLTYYLTDSAGVLLQKKLISDFLFDGKTGEPFGNSGLGDIYDHQLPLLKNYTFKHPGHYKIKFEQFMRMDTLPGILAVGVRVEKAPLPEQ
jgi:gliding motility-associated lipoprotein GldH